MSNCKGKELYPHIFEPLRIGKLRFKNRIIAAPTSPSMVDVNGHFTQEMIVYLEEKAKGGAAVVTYGEAIVHSATGKSHNKQIQLDSYGVRQTLAESVNRIHNAGAYANIQLSHGGMFGGLTSVGGTEGKDGKAYGPVEMDMPQGHVYEMPKELILEIIESYGKAAKLCKEVGYDMVQVHAAHGWLFSQFLSPKMNTRTDEFGGSRENRVRFLSMALDEIRKAVGPGFPIECRFAGDDFSENGMSQEECIEVAKLIDDKVDLFNISCGNHEDPTLFCRTHPSSFLPRGVNVYLAAEMKKHVKTPIACIGSLQDPAQIEEILATGQADMVEIARGLVADPYIPNKALMGEAEDITPCLRCYECLASSMNTEQLKCAVNPTQGQQLQELEGVKPADRVKKILVIGGGPAGMEAAITAAKRGHDVTIVEKSDKLGGNMHPAGTAYFKRDIADLCKVLVRRVEKAGVKVIYNTEADPQYVKDFAPDALFVAIGSNELKPPIKGIDGDNVIMAIDAELHPEKLGKRLAIMGGGLVGAEAAISFASEGHEVSVIEMLPGMALNVNSLYRGGLMPADTVVCALGFRSPYALVDSLVEGVDEYYIIGDCRNVGQIMHAVNNGYYAAREV